GTTAERGTTATSSPNLRVCDLTAPDKRLTPRRAACSSNVEAISGRYFLIGASRHSVAGKRAAPRCEAGDSTSVFSPGGSRLRRSRSAVHPLATVPHSRIAGRTRPPTAPGGRPRSARLPRRHDDERRQSGRMLAENLLLLLAVLPFIGAISAVTMPVTARNAEVALAGSVMVAGLLALAALFGDVTAGQVVSRTLSWAPSLGLDVTL